MSTREVSRRKLLSSLGLAAGASLLSGCADALQGAPRRKKRDSPESEEAYSSIPEGDAASAWRYVKLDSADVAAEAYGLVPQGGCMYALFASIVTAMGRVQGEPYLSFPVHMMKYGQGGVGLWGSLCGAVNGGAAVIGLFAPEKLQREQLIAELFSWYESTELPTYRPKGTKHSSPVPKSVSHSVLCHVSVGRWCAASGEDVGSPAMNERCRRLTADVAAKTVELLNANLHEPCKFAGLSPEVKSCLSCHNDELHDTLGKMQCNSCHPKLSAKHPAIKPVPPKSSSDRGTPKLDIR